MKKIHHFFFLSITIVISSPSIAGIRLPAVIGSNMVLQQRSYTTLWGWANPNEKIIITTSWNNAKDSVAGSSNATWKIKIPTPAAGGPYTITLKGWNTIVLENVLIGEVWICSGQSNMEMSNTPQIVEELPKSRNENIRFFHIPRATSAYPQDNCQSSWEVCGPNSLRGFSAVGYFFGKKLQRDLNVPIGLIESAWGGTPVESWTSAAVIENDPLMKNASAKLPATPWGPHLPGLIYNAMIAPIVNFDIAGVLWYQGEANVGIPHSYQKTLTSMIDTWRENWQKEFPFYYVQIAPYKYGRQYEGALLMEQQTRVLAHPHVGMVVITDLVDDIQDIHPKNKYDVGTRLANLALGDTYKQSIPVFKSPLFKNMEVSKNKASLFFDNAPNGFVVRGNSKVTDFFIAGSDKIFLPADVKIEKDRIIVSNKQIPNPIAVRFAFSNTAMSNLFSKEGLPVTPFRTDDWEVEMKRE